MDNCILLLIKILDLLKIHYTTKYIKDSVLSHPNHPSILCISDVLNRYNIGNVALKLDKSKFDEIPLPSIVQVSEKGGVFFVLKEVQKNDVIYFDDRNNLVKQSKEEFLKLWNEICLLVEKTKPSIEPGIEKKRERRKANKFMIGVSSRILSINTLMTHFLAIS